MVLPYFVALSNIFPEMQFTVDEMKANKEQWAQRVEEYDKQMKDNENASLWTILENVVYIVKLTFLNI